MKHVKYFDKDDRVSVSGPSGPKKMRDEVQKKLEDLTHLHICT